MGRIDSVSLPVMVAYRPRSLAVASNSLFQDIQLSFPSLGLMFLNLWMSCFAGRFMGIVGVGFGCVISRVETLNL